MDLREAKALEIAARYRLIFDKGVWLVPSQSSSAIYRVSLAPGNSICTCEDFNLRAEPCKHIMAARLVQARDYGGKPPVIDTDVLPKKTYKQNWPPYDGAQTTEKHRFGWWPGLSPRSPGYPRHPLLSFRWIQCTPGGSLGYLLREPHSS